MECILPYSTLTCSLSSRAPRFDQGISSMSAKHSPASASWGDLAFRLGVTVVALAVYRLGCRLPVPGINAEAVRVLSENSTGILALERCSIFALGMVPLFRALIFAELLKMLVPSVR